MMKFVVATKAGLCPEPRDFFRHGNIPKKSEKEKFILAHDNVNFYNSRRIYSALQYRTPDEVYFGTCNRQTVGYSKTRVFTPIFS